MANLAKLIGNRIKQIRKQKGLRQEDMEALGLSYKYFQKIEQGRANITLGTVEKVAEALGVSPEELFALPFSNNPEANEVASAVAGIISGNEIQKVRKLNVFIKELL